MNPESETLYPRAQIKPPIRPSSEPNGPVLLDRRLEFDGVDSRINGLFPRRFYSERLQVDARRHDLGTVGEDVLVDAQQTHRLVRDGVIVGPATMSWLVWI
jgi:hypothetical protein